MKNRTTVERTSDREVVVTRTINGPARIVFEAFTNAELLERWWVPKSMGMTLLSCEVDARVGGKYRLEFDVGGPEPAAFFGTYVEVEPYSRLAWTNEEGGEGGSVTTVTFEEEGGKTLVVLRERYPSKEALDAAGTGAADAMVETFDQLDELLVALGESSGQ
ncbi:MAG TPA: SRPBCC domain-containing protein [Longimicrobium sp.]